MDEFSFEEYDTNKLKEVQNPELLQNVQTPNPGYYEDKEKTQGFVDIDQYMKDLPPPNVQLNSSQMSPPISMPYDSGINNSYLSLVLSPNLRELEMMIRGLEYVKQPNPVTGKEEFVLRKIPNHPLNEYGINQIITQLKIYTSPEIKLGRKRTRDYYNSVQHVSKTIVRLIYKNLKSFGMETQEKQRNAKVFCDAIIEVIDAAYSRSIEGKENDLSRATEFKIEGNIDALNNPAQLFNPQMRERMKN